MELFTNFDGRISRKGFWMGFLGILAASMIAAWGMITVLPGGIALSIFQIVASAGIIYIWSAVLVKRLHDRNKSAMPWLIIFLAPGILYQIMAVFKIGYVSMNFANTSVMVPGTWPMVVIWVSLAVGLWMVIELGFLKGTPGTNNFGPDPLGDAKTAQTA